MSAGLRNWLREMPKAELHVHLEGTMTPSAYRRIAERNGIAVGDDTAATFACEDFPTFLQAFLTTVKALQKPEDFAELAREYLEVAAADGVAHVEFMLSPATQRLFSPHLDLEAMIEAVHREMAAAQEQTGISSLLLFDVVRNLGVNSALRDARLAERCQKFGVVGIGLGGDEKNYPARAFQEVFGDAEAAGLRRTAHAGEAAGAESIVEAVMLLHAERIGHGVAASKNAKVLKLLADRQIAVDCCLTSNRITGAVRSPQSHPLKEFLDAGLTATLSSDDPGFFGTSLLDEYELASEMLGLSRSQLVRLAANGFRASFAAQEKKKAWLAELEQFAATTPV